ncbi:MAG: hypothetical protein RLZZ138_549 [Actinomycetota bacterium]
MKNVRKIFAIAIALVLVHLGFLMLSVNQGWMEEPIPVHWGPSLQPDRFVSFEQHLIEISILQVLALLFLGISAFTKKRLLSGLLGYSGVGVFLLLQLIAWTTTMIQLSDTQQGFPFNLFLILLAIPMALVVVVLQVPQVELGERLRVKLSGVPMLTLDFDDIVGTGIVELRARDYGGLGIRYSRGKLAFMPKPGRGLELKLKSGESVVIFSTQPEVLQSLVINKMERL